MRGLPSTRDFGKLSRAAQAEGLRVDPERGLGTRPKEQGLAPANVPTTIRIAQVSPSLSDPVSLCYE